MVIEIRTYEPGKETNGVKRHTEKERGMERGPWWSSTRTKYYKNAKIKCVTLYIYLITKK